MIFGKDIISKILSRLSVKSLLIFKCVCKEWCKLIESDFFISQHFNRETNHSCLLVQHAPRNISLSHFALFPDKDLEGTPPTHEDLYQQLDIGLPFSRAHIVGPVNGLFFVRRDLVDIDFPINPMAIRNLATRRLKRIIYPMPTMKPYYHRFGFGFDSSSNDYKVIWFGNCFRTGHPCGITNFTIYSLSKDSWSSPLELTCEPRIPRDCYLVDSMSNTYINGACYWLCWHRSEFGCSILSFDMSSEGFRGINGPCIKELDDVHNPYLSSQIKKYLILYNDHLALLISKYVPNNKAHYHMWIMEDEGHWIKHLTIIDPYLDWGRAMGIWKDNELLIYDPRSRLLLYNVDNSEIKDLGIQNRYGPRVFYRTFSYKESLVSVIIGGSGRGTEKDWAVFECEGKDWHRMNKSSKRAILNCI